MTLHHAAIRFFSDGTIKTACGIYTGLTAVNRDKVLLNLEEPHAVTCKRCQAAMVPSFCFHLYGMEALQAGHRALAKHYATGYVESQVKAISQAEERLLSAKEEHAKAKEFLLETLGYDKE